MALLTLRNLHLSYGDPALIDGGLTGATEIHPVIQVMSNIPECANSVHLCDEFPGPLQ